MALLRAPRRGAKDRGGTALGAVLSCSATWAPDLPGAFLYRARGIAYHWTRDGAEVIGPRLGIYTAYATGDTAAA